MMRKHPEVVALVAIGLGLFASVGLEAGIRQIRQDSFRVRPLVFEGQRLDVDRIAEEAAGTVVREVLRELCR
jgi:hypothetical protein